MKYLFTWASALLFYGWLTLATTPLVNWIVASRAEASDWSSCGIKPPPPIECIHCRAFCSCESNGVCEWIWISR